MEVEANLNYVSIDALATREMLEVKLERAEARSDKWESLFEDMMGVLLETEQEHGKERGIFEENLQIAAQLLDSWQNRALILESAIKTYAGHVWNDIKQKLKEPYTS
jgi:hypothetical protein